VTPNSSLTPSAASGALSPSLIVSESAPVSNSSYGPICQEVCHRSLSDADREIAIVFAGKAIEKYMADWEAHGCFAAHGDADRARRLMELLIAGRSPEQVARMEAAQAERMAQEPGTERGAEWI